MNDLTQIIHALENCMAPVKCLDCPWEECEEQYEKVKLPRGLANEILAVMKSQGARVMTLEEVMDFDGPVYVIWQDEKSGCWAICPPERDIMAHSEWNTIHFRGGPVNQIESKYRKDWVCLTSKPTDEQRKTVKWE